MKLFFLPKSCFTGLLQDWLPLKEFLFLNSSFCNKIERPKLLEIFKIRAVFHFNCLSICIRSTFRDQEWTRTVINCKNVAQEFFDVFVDNFHDIDNISFFHENVTITNLITAVVKGTDFESNLCTIYQPDHNDFSTGFGILKCNDSNYINQIYYGEIKHIPGDIKAGIPDKWVRHGVGIIIGSGLIGCKGFYKDDEPHVIGLCYFRIPQSLFKIASEEINYRGTKKRIKLLIIERGCPCRDVTIL
jgi:hypothetical protein